MTINQTNVPYQFGRYMAVAEFILDGISMSLATTQPKAQFVRTINLINNPAAKKNKRYILRRIEIDMMLSSIIDIFPADLPAIFNLQGQSDMMMGYYKQKQEIDKKP